MEDVHTKIREAMKEGRGGGRQGSPDDILESIRSQGAANRRTKLLLLLSLAFGRRERGYFTG
jgi:hypothetical protein